MLSLPHDPECPRIHPTNKQLQNQDEYQQAAIITAFLDVKSFEQLNTQSIATVIYNSKCRLQICAAQVSTYH